MENVDITPATGRAAPLNYGNNDEKTHLEDEKDVNVKSAGFDESIQVLPAGEEAHAKQ